jgi:hypothetical protein
MNDDERLKLQEMIKANNVEDQTAKIRELKHSKMLRANIESYIQLVRKYPNSQHKDFFKSACLKQCAFLFNNYTDIYNKLTKNELNITILLNFVDVLSDIENGVMDQHEGSFKIGKILKEMYIDTALRKEQKLESRNQLKREKPKATSSGKKISYSDYKARKLQSDNVDSL